MNYDQFLENISADIKEALEPEFGPLHTEIKDVEKLSGRSYTGLMIRKEAENIAMSMNLTQRFDQLQQGRPYIAISNEVIGEVAHHMEPTGQTDQGTGQNWWTVVLREQCALLRTLPERQQHQYPVATQCRLQLRC